MVSHLDPIFLALTYSLDTTRLGSHLQNDSVAFPGFHKDEKNGMDKIRNLGASFA